MEHIVKRKGHTETFDSRKIYASVFAACMSLRMSDGEAELLADTISKEVTQRIQDSQRLSSTALHALVVESIQKYNHEVAFIYDTHRDIS